MPQKTPPAVLLLLCLLCVGGCRATGRYARARAADVADVVSLELTHGPGADLHAQLTGYLGAAAGWSTQKGLMLHGRHVGLGRRETAGFVLLSATAAEGQKMWSLAGDAPHPDTYSIWALLLPLSMQAAPGVHLGYVPSWPHTFDVAVGGSLLVGFHVGLSPIELLDCAVGLIGLDPAGDDPAIKEEKTVPEREELPPLMILPPAPPQWYIRMPD